MTKIKNFVIIKDNSLYEVFERIECTKEENEELYNMKASGMKLPDDIKEKTLSGGGFYRLKRADADDDELKRYIELKKMKDLETIKSCVLFFTVLAVISLAAGILWSLA